MHHYCNVVEHILDLDGPSRNKTSNKIIFSWVFKNIMAHIISVWHEPVDLRGKWNTVTWENGWQKEIKWCFGMGKPTCLLFQSQWVSVPLPSLHPSLPSVPLVTGNIMPQLQGLYACAFMCFHGNQRHAACFMSLKPALVLLGSTESDCDSYLLHGDDLGISPSCSSP